MTALQDVTDGLYQIMHEDWRPEDPRWQSRRRQLLYRINWWYRIFVAAHIPDSERSAQLVELIRSAPADLYATVSDTLRQREAVTVLGLDNPKWQVFCPRPLLDEAVRHLLDNAYRHRVPGAEVRIGVEYRPAGRDHVEVVIRNTGSQPRPIRGRGLGSFNQKLLPFGGSLTGNPLEQGDWTFEATVTLALWQGV
jgi:signal transduction histidine kinase